MKSKIRFYNLSPEMKSNIRDGAILTTAIAGGYGIFKVFGSNLFSEKETVAMAELPIDQQDEIVSEKFEISSDTGVEFETDFTVIESIEEQSFADAFSEARTELGPGGFFNYKGQTYSTFYDEEFSAKSADEQDAYAQNIDDQIDIDSAEEFDASESLSSNLEDESQQTIVDNGTNVDNNSDEQIGEVIIDDSDESGETNDLSDQTIDQEEIVISEEVESVPDFDVSEDLDLSILGQDSISDDAIESITSEEVNSNITLEADVSVDGETTGVEVSYEEFEDASFGDATLQAESSDEFGFATSEDISSSDFNDVAFEGAEVLESSDAASDSGFAIVEDSDFSDPLFDADSTIAAESSNNEGNTAFADVSDADFSDPLFGDEPVQNTGDVAIVEVSSDLLTPAEGEDIVTSKDELADIVEGDIEVDVEVDLFEDLDEEEDFLSSDIDELD